MADPFDVLNRPATPVVPRAEFVGTLRRRLEDALRPPPPAVPRTERSPMPTATAGGGSEAAEAAQVDLGQRAPAPPPTPTAEQGDGDLGYLTLGVPDLQRAKAFYGALLGWRFEEDSTFEGRTSSHVGNVNPPLGVIGGEAAPRPTLYFRVGDITGAVARIRELGGQAGDPVLHPSGWNASCADDQGLTFDLWQPAEGY